MSVPRTEESLPEPARLCWSRYNYFFESHRHGHLLYNALTNSFAHVAGELVEDLQRIQADPAGFDFGTNPALYIQLVGMKVLVSEGEERAFLNIFRYKDLERRFDNKRLSLTIAPTLLCNFDCVYCYEAHRRAVHMNDETEDRLIDFIRQFGALRYMDILWFGGEPFLRLDRIASITARVKNLGVPFIASAVTNGYLLDEHAISRLDDLKIRRLQVTLDGEEGTHDRRRFTAGGGKTYATILSNLDMLLARWDGWLSVRVNVDKTNREQFHRVQALLADRYPGKHVRVYPGFIEEGTTPEIGCEIDRDEAALFHIEQYRKHGVTDMRFYPEPQRQGCIATWRNGFVIGPNGEVYACWHDMGDPDKVVGDIRQGVPWDMAKRAEYLVGTDYFDDPECRECFYFPVCSGGCPRIRGLLHAGAKHAAGANGSCVLFKDRLPELLEIHYEIKHGSRGATALRFSRE